MRFAPHPSNNSKCSLCRCRGPHSLCIVTELCASSLDQLLYTLRAPELPAGRALAIALDAVNGLAFLHAATPIVIHRDIKPGNILLDRVRLGPFFAQRCFALFICLLLGDHHRHIERKCVTLGSPVKGRRQMTAPGRQITLHLKFW